MCRNLDAALFLPPISSFVFEVNVFLIHMSDFDIFLSHNSADKGLVEAMAEILQAEGLKPWLDKWCLVPGQPWQQELATILRRYCSYAEALAKGCSLAREGIRIVLGLSETISSKEVSQQYRKYLFVQGSLPTKTKQPAFDLATAQTVVEQQNGELSLPDRLRCRIRYFTDGVILGSQSFVESHFYKLKHKLGYKRGCPATRLTALGCADTLWVFRDLRVRFAENFRDSESSLLVRYTRASCVRDPNSGLDFFHFPLV